MGIRMAAKSQCRQNFHEECEAGINKQINMELTASYIYQSLAYYCDRDDVAFPHLHKMFKKSGEEEREHAEKLMEYQNKRGGRIVLQDIKKPEVSEYGTVTDMLSLTLQLEKDVNQSLIDLHKIAEKHEDGQFADFIEGDLLTRAKRCGNGLGEFLFEAEALE